MREKIINLIGETLRLNPGIITEETMAKDVEAWDSLAQVLIIGELESRLGICIPLDEAGDIYGVKDILEKAGV